MSMHSPGLLQTYAAIGRAKVSFAYDTTHYWLCRIYKFFNILHSANAMSRSVTNQVTAEQLFAEETDRNAIHIASNMIKYYLMLNKYIRLNNRRGIEQYQYVYNNIMILASEKHSHHARKTRYNVQFGTPQNFDASVKDMFLYIYNKYATNEEYRHVPLLRICVLAMNICGYIHNYRKPRWCERNLVMLLARVIGGELFQRDIHLDTLEALAVTHYRCDAFSFVHNALVESSIRQRGLLRI